jgi:hypothetical protein
MKKTMHGALWLNLQFAVWEAEADVLLDFYQLAIKIDVSPVQLIDKL